MPKVTTNKHAPSSGPYPQKESRPTLPSSGGAVPAADNDETEGEAYATHRGASRSSTPDDDMRLVELEVGLAVEEDGNGDQHLNEQSTQPIRSVNEESHPSLQSQPKESGKSKERAPAPSPSSTAQHRRKRSEEKSANSRASGYGDIESHVSKFRVRNWNPGSASSSSPTTNPTVPPPVPANPPPNSVPPAPVAGPSINPPIYTAPPPPLPPAHQVAPSPPNPPPLPPPAPTPQQPMTFQSAQYALSCYHIPMNHSCPFCLVYPVCPACPCPLAPWFPTHAALFSNSPGYPPPNPMQFLPPSPPIAPASAPSTSRNPIPPAESSTSNQAVPSSTRSGSRS
ncbi:hypothetical protein BOTBODRAFT_61917 [Botryobasidium botryosum FD-172 SS1]|uniref:Uncharacterized protein n=1 Tax=Botryobasidium botryosum (strain FD-172 SS1) TaxID=930990 RepID=A0A067N9S4_BOTB1|nr:hypothetical protein BOTBODRAFT_61917 [Botryobasidium botryosum FD-172 SS1]